MSANNQEEYSSALAFAAVRNYYENKLNNMRRRIQFNLIRLNNIRRELANLEASRLPRPRNEKAERMLQLKTKIVEVLVTIRKLEEEEQTLQSWVDQSYL